MGPEAVALPAGMSTLLDALNVNCPEAEAWVRQAVDRLESSRLDDAPVLCVAMGRLGMAGVGDGALLETVFVLGAEAVGLGQETSGLPRCRWIPLDSVVEIEDRDEVDGVCMRVDIILDSEVRLLLEAGASFIHDLLTVLGSLQGVDVEAEQREFEDRSFERGVLEDGGGLDGAGTGEGNCEGEVDATTRRAAGTSSAPVNAQMEGVTYSSRFETSGAAARAAARSWLKDDRRRSRSQSRPRSELDGSGGGTSERQQFGAGPAGPPGEDVQAASADAPRDAWRWSAHGEEGAGSGDEWVDAPVAPIVPPPGYRGEGDDEGSEQWVERLAGLGSAAGCWSPEQAPTSAGAPSGSEEDDVAHTGSGTKWQDPAIVWPQPLQGVTYLEGDPAHPKRRRGLFVVFSPAGIRAVAVGYSQFCIDVAWSRVRDLVVETAEELEERTRARVDPSSSGLVIVTDDATLVFEYRKHSLPATRSALASVLSLVARL